MDTTTLGFGSMKGGSLVICCRLAVGGIACPSGSMAGIEVLDMGAFEFDWEHCQLTFPHLTWLAMTESSLHRVSCQL